MDRRKFIQVSTVGSLAVTIPSNAEIKGLATPPEGEGPFYPIVAQEDKDFDLTQVEGRNGLAQGQHIFVKGKVLDTSGNPVPEVTVDLWQANAVGRYNHPHDKNPAPVDDNFQSWAILATDSNGEFNFKTVLPGPYPVSEEWSRPPHIHYKISKKGYVELTTQMYFPDQPLNSIDRLLQRKSAEEQARMIAKLSTSNANTYEYSIILEKA